MTTKTVLLHAIRAKCLDCSGFRPSEVRNCLLTTCDLWPYRFGRDPAPSLTRGFAKPLCARKVLLRTPPRWAQVAP